MKKWIFLGIGVVVLLAVSVGATLFFTKGSDSAAIDPAAAPVAAAAVAKIAPVYYHYVQPEFVVNFNRKERPRALMIEIVVSSHNEKALDVLDTHSPELRNNLLLLMTESDGTTLTTALGKNALRESVKFALNELLIKHGSSDAVADIFFTRFVLQ